MHRLGDLGELLASDLEGHEVAAHRLGRLGVGSRGRSQLAIECAVVRREVDHDRALLAPRRLEGDLGFVGKLVFP